MMVALFYCQVIMVSDRCSMYACVVSRGSTSVSLAAVRAPRVSNVEARHRIARASARRPRAESAPSGEEGCVGRCGQTIVRRRARRGRRADVPL